MPAPERTANDCTRRRNGDHARARKARRPAKQVRRRISVHALVRRPATAVFALLAATAPPTARSEEIDHSAVLFVSSDIRGYLAPCGCTEAMRGGIDRAAEQIARARAANPFVLFIDGGDALFSRRLLSAREVPQEELKARTIARALLASRLATRAVGALDEARGPRFRKSLQLPDQEYGSVRLFEQAGLKVAIVAAKNERELLAASKRARREGANFVSALYYQPLEPAQRAASNPDLEVNVLFATRAADEMDGEDNRLVRTRVPVAGIQSKGRSLARVDIHFTRAGEPFALQKTSQEREREISSLDERIELLKRELNAPGLGEQIKELKRAKLAELIQRREAIGSAPLPAEQGNLFAVRFIPLEPALPSNAAVKALMDDYDRQVGLLNLAWAEKHGRDCPRAAKGQPAYTGNEACQGCHAEAFPVWDASKHAHAYQTLEKLGRQYDLNCIGCHVTGYDRPGGVCRVDKVKNRTSVGCESCHGPGSIHSEDPDQTNVVVARPGKADCVRCHNPENSPHFDFASFLPQILGPGHLGQKTSTPPKTR